MATCIVAGSRGWTDRSKVKKAMNAMWKEFGAFTVLTGGARGVDTIAHHIAVKADQNTIVMQAQWDKFGRSAGYRRNVAMAVKADYLLALWDGKSPGTKHMIDIAKDHGLTIRIVRG